jgi:DNA-binding XRE family transcriptional regulator
LVSTVSADQRESQYQDGIPLAVPPISPTRSAGRIRYQIGIDGEKTGRYAPAMPETRSSVLLDRAEAARLLGRRLAALREKAGLTQLAAARALSAPQSAIAKLESGRRQLRFLEAVRLAALYGVDCAEFDPENATGDPR